MTSLTSAKISGSPILTDAEIPLGEPGNSRPLTGDRATSGLILLSSVNCDIDRREVFLVVKNVQSVFMADGVDENACSSSTTVIPNVDLAGGRS